MNKIKLFGSYLAFIIKRIYWTLRDKRFWILLILFLAFYLWGWLNANYFFQSPVKEWRCWMCSRSIKNTQKTAIPATLSAQLIPTTPPPKTEKEIVMEEKHGSILWKIMFIETNFGATDGCRKQGKFGGFGVMDNNHKVVCYDTFQESADRAEYWFNKLNPDENLEAALCQWNTGKRQPMCSYSQTFMSL